MVSCSLLRVFPFNSRPTKQTVRIYEGFLASGGNMKAKLQNGKGLPFEAESPHIKLVE